MPKGIITIAQAPFKRDRQILVGYPFDRYRLDEIPLGIQSMQDIGLSVVIIYVAAGVAFGIMFLVSGFIWWVVIRLVNMVWNTAPAWPYLQLGPPLTLALAAGIGGGWLGFRRGYVKWCVKDIRRRPLP